MASELGEPALFVHTDVSEVDRVKSMVSTVIERFGRLDILVNNAGHHLSKSIEDTSEEEWQYIINTNLTSTFLCSKYAIPHLKKNSGCIINISSMVGLVGQSNAGAYAASKGGQVAMAKNMALDLAADHVRVNAICPGWIQTPLVEDWFGQQQDPDASRKHMYSMHPLGHIGTVEDVGRTAVYLASDDAHFVTGTAIKIEGAITLGY